MIPSAKNAIILATTIGIICSAPVSAAASDEAKSLMDSGIRHTLSGEHLLALGDFQKASNLNSHDAKIWMHLAECHNLLGHQKQSIDSIDKAIAEAPNDVDLVLLRAGMFLYGRDYQSCMKDLNNVLAKKPGSRKALFLMGSCCMALGQASKGLEYHGRLVKQTQRDEIYYEAAAMSYLQNQQYGKAEQLLKEGQTRYPKDLILHHYRAQALIGLSRFKEAVREASYMLQGDVSNPATSQLRGGAYFMLGEYEKAARDLKQVLAFNPRDSAALCLLLSCASRANNLELKNDCARQLRLLSGEIKNDCQLIKIANVELDCGYKQNALSCFKKALQIRKENGSLGKESIAVMSLTARLCRDSGKREEAIKYYEMASSLAGDDSTNSIELGRLYYEDKQYLKAEQCLNKALKNVDLMKRPKVLNMLSVVYREQNKMAQASQAERQARHLTKTIYGRNP